MDGNRLAIHSPVRSTAITPESRMSDPKSVPDAHDATNDGRRHVRAPIELQVEYKKLNSFFSDYTKNISKGGTFIKTNRPLKVGTEFLFKLAIPVLDDPFQIRGQVAWVNTENDRQKPEVKDLGMGIRFLYDDPEQRQKFETLVEEMMIESLGETVYNRLLKDIRQNR